MMRAVQRGEIYLHLELHFLPSKKNSRAVDLTKRFLNLSHRIDLEHTAHLNLSREPANFLGRPLCPHLFDRPMI